MEAVERPGGDLGRCDGRIHRGRAAHPRAHVSGPRRLHPARSRPRERPLSPVGRHPPSILFAGYYRHAPNAEAARWLAREIFPAVRRDHPSAELVLVGEDPPADLKRPADDGIVTTGAVPDITEFLDRAAVVAAPIRTGGGVRVKVLEALGAGKAVVATRLAAEGIAAPPGKAILLADSVEELASCISLLLSEERRRRGLAEAGYEWARRELRPEATAERFDRLYSDLLARRQR